MFIFTVTLGQELTRPHTVLRYLSTYIPSTMFTPRSARNYTDGRTAGVPSVGGGGFERTPYEAGGLEMACEKGVRTNRAGAQTPPEALWHKVDVDCEKKTASFLARFRHQMFRCSDSQMPRFPDVPSYRYRTSLTPQNKVRIGTCPGCCCKSFFSCSSAGLVEPRGAKRARDEPQLGCCEGLGGHSALMLWLLGPDLRDVISTSSKMGNDIREKLPFPLLVWNNDLLAPTVSHAT
jgi:hypothetical protein